jgi:hypothetical protein
MVDTLKQNLKDKSTWLRGLYMLLFILFISVAKVVILAVIIFQFLSALITHKSNQRLLKLGQSLSTYSYQILVFLTFNSEYRPYPFGAWPRGEPSAKEKEKEKTAEGQESQ